MAHEELLRSLAGSGQLGTKELQKLRETYSSKQLAKIFGVSADVERMVQPIAVAKRRESAKSEPLPKRAWAPLLMWRQPDDVGYSHEISAGVVEATDAKTACGLLLLQSLDSGRHTPAALYYHNAAPLPAEFRVSTILHSGPEGEGDLCRQEVLRVAFGESSIVRTELRHWAVWATVIQGGSFDTVYAVHRAKHSLDATHLARDDLKKRFGSSARIACIKASEIPLKASPIATGPNGSSDGVIRTVLYDANGTIAGFIDEALSGTKLERPEPEKPPEKTRLEKLYGDGSASSPGVV